MSLNFELNVKDLQLKDDLPSKGKQEKQPSPILSVKNLSVGHNPDQILLENINFEIYSGEIFMIVGGSGVGKTTLLHNLIGLLPPQRGEVRLFDTNLFEIDEAEKNKILQSIGVTYQQGALFSSLTVYENLALTLREFSDLPENMIRRVCNMKLKLVSLEGFADFLPDQLSGGMVKRVAIARALITDPKIIFFDEPGSGLDPVLVSELDDLILDLSKNIGITFVIVSHDLRSVFHIADRVAVLDKSAKGTSFIGAPRDSEQLKKSLKKLTIID